MTTSSSGGSNLNLHGLPAPIATIVRAAYGDATGRIFLIAAGAAIVALLATAWLPNRPLRSTIDIDPTLDPNSKESASQDNPTDIDTMAALDAELAVLAESGREEDRVWEGAERVLSESELVPRRRHASKPLPSIEFTLLGPCHRLRLRVTRLVGSSEP
ncbi:hypothetical protein QX204_13415 [Nocardia sp. PE-7]|uniref:hypothetical protein n=1 Tax=Nocardia sp. PE-7 TaxID=3058426 RepID=UPI002657D3D9|nr:hypothetical protein [Nocardia sp. PE-7]WKG12402.1 hypothetical protein QX204_13415 [Nocardia sp. PE-7]